MARVVYTASAIADLERALEFVAELGEDAADAAAAAIDSAIAMLEHHPLIGRPVRGNARELIISFGRTGYIALYRYVPVRREVRILAIRHQRELDYP